MGRCLRRPRMPWHWLLWQPVESLKGQEGDRKKPALGACPSCALRVRDLAKGRDPTAASPSCSEPRPEAATLSGSRKAQRLGEAAPSVGFKRPLSAPGVAERFLRSSVLLATAAFTCFKSVGPPAPLRLCKPDCL